jgi:hypothetical protein
MILTFIILSVVSVITGVVVFNKLSDKQEDVVENPPFDQEPVVILDPPALPTFPDIVFWDLMTCEEIEVKIGEINELLMTSKFPQEIREFWNHQLEKGYIIFAEKCIRTEESVS